jgi:hypothetical protein
MANAGSGLATQLTSPVAETTYGVVPAALASTTKFSAFKSETMKLTKTPVQGIGLLQNKLHPVASRRVITNWSAGGGINMDLPARGLQQWLYPMFGSWGQTPATLTQDLTTGAYKAVHAPGLMRGNSVSFQKGVPAIDGTIEPVTYVGAKFTEWELSVQTGEIAQLAITVDARNELAGTMNADPLNNSLPGLVSYVAPPVGSVFYFAQATLFTGGTCTTTSGVTTVASPVVAGNIKSASIKYSVPLDTERFFLGKAGFKDDQLDNGLRAITGQFEIEWLSSEARYNAFASDTPTPLQLQFLGPAIGTGSDFSTFTMLIPDVFLDDASPQVGGPEVVKETIPFTGLDDGTNNPIQATYWTLDTA